jgi:hypothetical protein
MKQRGAVLVEKRRPLVEINLISEGRSGSAKTRPPGRRLPKISWWRRKR